MDSNINIKNTQKDILNLLHEVTYGSQNQVYEKMYENHHNKTINTIEHSLTFSEIFLQGMSLSCDSNTPLRFVSINNCESIIFNISEYAASKLKENAILEQSVIDDYDIANLKVNAKNCIAMLSVDELCSGIISTNITEQFWCMKYNRCMPLFKIEDGITVKLYNFDAHDMSNYSITFDIVKSTYGNRKIAREFLQIVPEERRFIMADNGILMNTAINGLHIAINIIVKLSKPVKGIKLNLLNYANLQMENKLIDTYLDFVYDTDKDYWILTLQDYIDDMENIGNLKNTVNLSRLSAPAFLDFEFIDRYDRKSNNNIQVSVLTNNIQMLRCMHYRMGYAFSK